MKDKPKLLLFTAAGFSIDLLESKTKSNQKLTTNFLNNLITNFSFFQNEVFDSYKSGIKPKYLDENSLLEDCKILIGKYAELYKIATNELKNSDEVILNFEHLIYLSELISDTNGNVWKDGNSILPKLKQIVLSNKLSSLNFSLEDTLKIKSLILGVIYAYFELNIENTKYLKSFNELLLKTHEVKYHTINYDLVLEETLDIFDDLLDSCNQYVRGEDSFYISNHLHGQINLVSNKLHIKSNAFYYRSGSEQAEICKNKVKEIGIGIRYGGRPRHDFDMITGLDKSTKILNDHYSLAYQKFIVDVRSCDELLIIGYSFNDSHINSVLRTNIKHFKRIIVVDYIPDNEMTKENMVAKIRADFFGKIWDGDLYNEDWFSHDLEISLTNCINESSKKVCFKYGKKNVFFEFHFDGCINYLKSSLLGK